MEIHGNLIISYDIFHVVTSSRTDDIHQENTLISEGVTNFFLSQL